MAGNDIQPKLMWLVSRERMQPLDGYEGAPTTGTTTYTVVPATWPTTSGSSPDYGYTSLNFKSSRVPYNQPQSATDYSPNTIGQMNRQTSNNLPNGFTLWQPHFDRDFASVMELLSVPLYDPSIVTQSMAPKDTQNQNASIRSLTVESPLPPSAGSVYLPLIAQAKIFRPQHPMNYNQFTPPAQPPHPTFDNRWHRIFELLEVPTRENLQVENYLQTNFSWLSPTGLQRVPAKMNINCLRNAENLFGLFDDPSTFNLSTIGYAADGSYLDRKMRPMTPGTTGGSSCSAAASGVDYQISTQIGTNVNVVGAPGSRPFKSFSSIDQNPNNYTSGHPSLNSVT